MLLDQKHYNSAFMRVREKPAKKTLSLLEEITNEN
jgi:hypothetical protein